MLCYSASQIGFEWLQTARQTDQSLTQDCPATGDLHHPHNGRRQYQHNYFCIYPATMLCAKCQGLCSSIHPHQDNDFPHHETVEELRTSANSGCLLCKIIHRDLGGELDERINISIRVTIKTRRDTGIEVSFVDPGRELAGGPRNDRKPPVVYVIFQSFSLPRKFSCAQIYLY
jgi:hypothetical protein